MSEVKGRKISELSEKTSLTGNEFIPVQDGSDNKKVKTDKFAKASDITRLDSEKQAKLVSGVNISTINGNDITKGGNIKIEGGGSGTTDYNQLTNKPKINGNELSGNKTSDQLGLQENLKGKTIATINGTPIELGGNVQLAGGEGGGGSIVVDAELNADSTNAIQNQAVTKKLATLEGQMVVSEEVSAQALLEQANNVEGLKKAIVSLLNGSVYLPNVLTRKVQIDGCDSILLGTDVPSVAPEFAGQEYIDTVHKIAYKACGKENISDWKPINVA